MTTRISYYRLKQTDFDGRFFYSFVEDINISGSDNTQIIIYPNPEQDQITIYVNKLEFSEIKFYSVLGQDMTRRVREIKSNHAQTIIVDLDFPSGIYYIKTPNAINKFYKKWQSPSLKKIAFYDEFIKTVLIIYFY